MVNFHCWNESISPSPRKTLAHKESPRLMDHPQLLNNSSPASPRAPSKVKTLEPLHSTLEIQKVRRLCFPSFTELLGLRQPPPVYTRVLPVSSPVTSSLEPENPTLAGCPEGPAPATCDGARRPGQTLSQQLHAPGRLARQAGPGPRGGASSLGSAPAAGAPKNRQTRLRRQPEQPPDPRPDPLLPTGLGPAPPRAPVLPPAGHARTCRTRCSASTKPSAFIPTGALCPCTSSAITAPAAAPLPRPASPSVWGPVAGKGKSPHFRRKGRRDTGRERSRVCRASHYT